MNNKNSRLWFGVAIALALLAGFGVAKLTNTSVDQAKASVEAESHDEGEAHAEDDEHADEPAGESKEKEGLVTLTPDQIKASGIDVVAAAIGGRVERVLVAPGARVRAGEPLAIVLSGDAAVMRANADAAAAQAEAARLVLGRDQGLQSQGIVARQELEASRARSLAADAAARAAHAQVAAAGSPDSRGRTTITSPVSGVVGSVQVTPGGFVSAGDLVATVSDPDQNELVFTAPPALASQVSPGMTIETTGPAGSFKATVIGAAADVREQSGVAIIRARAESADLPPAGSPVAGVLVASDKSDTLTVPADAVQTIEGRSVVFVATDDGFQATPVLPGRRAGGHVEILNGLSGKERIAASNAFLLKAEMAKGEAEHGH